MCSTKLAEAIGGIGRQAASASLRKLDLLYRVEGL